MTPPRPELSTHATEAQPVGDSGGECEQLIEMLTRQRDLYRSLDGLSDKQQQIIAEGQAEQLLGVLSERQVIVDHLTQINGELAPLRHRMSEIAEAAPAGRREALRSRVDEVQQLLASIIERDEEDRQSLEASKSQVGKQLGQVSTAPAAINAYRANAYAANRGSPAAGPTSAARFTDSRG